MIYVAEGINLRRMDDMDEEFTHYRLAHIINCLENGRDFTAQQIGQMLAEVQVADHKEPLFQKWMYKALEDLFAAGNEAFKEEVFVAKENLCVNRVERNYVPYRKS